MGYSKEAKVGIVFISAVVMLILMASYLGAFKANDKGYEITALYKDVTGLFNGAVIRYAGVDIGRVKSIKLAQNDVEVVLFINDPYQIPEGSDITIATSGVLGEKYIDIAPPAQLQGGYIRPGTVITGKESAMAAMMQSAQEIMTGVQQMIKSVNTSLLGPEQQASYKKIIRNADATAENIKTLSSNANRMIVANQANVEMMVANLRAMSASMRDFSQKADHFMTVLNKDDQAAKDLRDTVANVKNTTAHLDKILAALEPTLTDPKTADDIKQTAKNARILSDTSVDLLKDKQFSFNGGGDMTVNSNNGDIQVGAWGTMGFSTTSFIKVGYDNIGGTNGVGGVNLQYGYHGVDARDYRVGLVDGQPGVGVDMSFNDNLWKLGLDLYDPNNLSIKARVECALTDNIYAVLQNYRINRSPRDLYLGIGARF